MTASAFGRLLYTDCPPGGGRGAGGGFQVQAQSPDVDPAQSAMAVSWLLYEVQNAWIVQRRPVEDFPLGFAHANGAGFGTAQSCYLGKEATGGRQGNHLADSLLTGDAALYGTIRPAQLWRSPLWRSVPWDSTECPPYEGGPEPGPLTLDAVAEWVCDRPERAVLLTRLLSVLENPAGERVVIVADSADEAMRWITAATLLLPERQALDMSFKVFSAAPLRAEQRVVAAPADLNPQLRPGRVSGVFVLDATACAADEAAASDRAEFLVGKLTGDGDPYDVVDAVELAGQLADGEWPADVDALRTGWALTRPDDPLPPPEALFRWLSGAKPEQRREHGPTVAAMLLGTCLAAQSLRWLDARSTELGIDPAVVRAQLLDAELAEALTGHQPPAAGLSPVPLDDQARRDAESKVASAVLRSSEDVLDAVQIDLVLRLARRHGVNLDLASPPLQRQLHKFAVAWIERPAAWDPRGWARRPEILDLAYGELRERFARTGAQRMMDRIRDVSPYFADRVEEPDDPLYCHLQGALLARTGAEQRQARLSNLLARVSATGDAPRRSAAAARLQEALLLWRAVDADSALLILRQLPARDIASGVANYLDDHLAEAAATPDAELLAVLGDLDKAGWQPSSDRLGALLTAERNVQKFIAGAADKRIIDGRYLRATVRLIHEMDPEVLVIRRHAILNALIASPSPLLGAEVFIAIPRKGTRVARFKPAAALIKLVAEKLGTLELLEDRVDATLWCLLVLADEEFAEAEPGRHERLSKAVAGFARALSDADAVAWRAEMSRHLKSRPELRPAWDMAFGVGAPGQGGLKQSINLWRTRP
jgi:hypothetical protein